MSGILDIDIDDELHQASVKLEFVGEVFEKLGRGAGPDLSGDACEGLSLILWDIQNSVNVVTLKKGAIKRMKKNPKEEQAEQ